MINLISDASFRRAFSRFYDLFVHKKDGYELSQNDFSNKYREKLEGLENYILPPATGSKLGGIILGDGLSADENGKTSVNFPDLSPYVTYEEASKTNRENNIRFAKIENAAKQKQEDDGVVNATIMKKIGRCETGLSDVKEDVSENSKRFANYLTLKDHDTAMAEISGKLETKADIETLNEAIAKKITRSDLDGSINNLLDTIRTEQEKAAEDRENLRAIKTDIASLNNLRQLVQSNAQDIDYIMKDIEGYPTKDDLEDYVKKEPGKRLTEHNFSYEDWDRLQSLHNYTLPAASKVTLGGVKAGSNVDISEDGTLNVNIPSIDGLISEEDSEKITSALSTRIGNCESNTSKQSDILDTLSSSLSAAKDKLTSLEKATRECSSKLETLATKTELTDSINTLDKSKVSTGVFDRHVAAKIGLSDLNTYVREKLESIAAIEANINNIRRTAKRNENNVAHCSNSIKDLSNAVNSIRRSIPEGQTFVMTQTGKGLSTNDFTDEQVMLLASALTQNDIGNKVVGLGIDNKIDAKYLPDEIRGICHVNDISQVSAGSKDILYFNKSDKKLYYYDGVNFRQTHDNLYDDNGIDLRTEMADLYGKRNEVNQNTNDIKVLKKCYIKIMKRLNGEEVPSDEEISTFESVNKFREELGLEPFKSEEEFIISVTGQTELEEATDEDIERIINQ